MSQLAGLLSRRDDDVTQLLLKKWSPTLAHDAYGLATPQGAEHSTRFTEFTTLTGATAISHRLIKVQQIDNPQPIQDGKKALVYIGRLWDICKPNTLFVADILRGDIEVGLRELLTRHEGSWITVVLEEGIIYCARDTIGAIPLYYGQNHELLGVSTDLKNLLRFGLEPERVKPGHIVKLDAKVIRDYEVAPLKEPSLISINLEEATDALERLLIQSINRTSHGLSSPILAFSGGIDSVVLAYYLKSMGSRPRLTCVGATNSRDIAVAEEAADALGLPLGVVSITDSDLDEHLGAILYGIEEADSMKVSVAAPLYFVALDAAQKHCKAVFSGNGCDELFGGYAKYVHEFQTQGDGVRATMFRDLKRSYEVNLERDWKICSNLGLELRLPYLDPELTQFALSLPLNHKLPTEGQEPRKIILRNLAKRIGLPQQIVNRPKKAAQYSSGTYKIIKNIAKKHGKSIVGYLSERLEKVRG